MGYPVDKKAQVHAELALLTPRLSAFAAALAGTEGGKEALLKGTRGQALSRAAKDRGHTPLLLWCFALMRSLWTIRSKSMSSAERLIADPRLFQPRSSLPGDDAGAASRMARFVAQLSPQQRGMLHLVYGERLSYDMVAEVFGVAVSTVMTQLAQAHVAMIALEDHAIAAAPLASASRALPEGPRGREWAA
jgi:DNA-directed RNA polymerase specialized sigma24 family protein